MPFFKSIRSGFLQGVFLLAPFHAAAWTATAEPIEKLLNAPTEEEKDKLTSRWRESIQEQLTSIASTVRILPLPNPNMSREPCDTSSH